jgi:hypothetical protein
MTDSESIHDYVVNALVIGTDSTIRKVFITIVVSSLHNTQINDDMIMKYMNTKGFYNHLYPICSDDKLHYGIYWSKGNTNNVIGNGLLKNELENVEDSSESIFECDGDMYIVKKNFANSLEYIDVDEFVKCYNAYNNKSFVLVRDEYNLDKYSLVKKKRSCIII